MYYNNNNNNKKEKTDSVAKQSTLQYNIIARITRLIILFLVFWYCGIK